MRHIADGLDSHFPTDDPHVMQLSWHLGGNISRVAMLKGQARMMIDAVGAWGWENEDGPDRKPPDVVKDMDEAERDKYHSARWRKLTAAENNRQQMESLEILWIWAFAIDKDEAIQKRLEAKASAHDAAAVDMWHAHRQDHAGPGKCAALCLWCWWKGKDNNAPPRRDNGDDGTEEGSEC